MNILMIDNRKILTSDPVHAPNYLREFPDFGLLGFGLPQGMVDESWHNDALPRFALYSVDGDEHPAICLYIDYEDITKREALSDAGRFSIYLGESMDEPALQTNDWTEAEKFIEQNRPFAGFEYNGTLITNPTYSDNDDQLTVSPDVYGFEIEQTGGGCTAWVKRAGLLGGGYLMLTDEGGTTHELGDRGEMFLIGVYDDEGDEASMHHAIVGNAGSQHVKSSLNAPFSP